MVKRQVREPEPALGCNLEPGADGKVVLVLWTAEDVRKVEFAVPLFRKLVERFREEYPGRGQRRKV